MVRKKKQARLNPWKWAFIGLVLVLAGCFIVMRAGVNLKSAESHLNSPKTSQQADQLADPYHFRIQTSGEQVENLANDYLSQLEGQASAVQLNIDQTIQLITSVEFLGHELAVEVDLEPRPTPAGNLILELEDFSVAGLSMPSTLLFTRLEQQFKRVDWIYFDRPTQSIQLLFEQQVFNDAFQLKIKEVDLKENRIQLDLWLDGAIFESVDGTK